MKKFIIKIRKDLITLTLYSVICNGKSVCYIKKGENYYYFLSHVSRFNGEIDFKQKFKKLKDIKNYIKIELENLRKRNDKI